MKLKFDIKKLHNICQSNDIAYLGLFGSFPVGEGKDDSDVDLLIDFNYTRSLLEKGRVQVEFQNLFN